MFKKNLIFITLCSLLISNTLAQTRKQIPSEKPKLIIGLVVNQMRYDYLYKYLDKFSQNGIRRLLNEGSNCKNATYGYQCTLSEPGYATISTGTNPSVHGIIGPDWYQDGASKKTSCSVDVDVKTIGGGSFDAGLYSPKKLMAPTVGDELRLSNNKQSKVISVSLDASASAFLGGLIPSSAWWFDFSSGNWVSSSYYLETAPDWVGEFNRKGLPNTYLQRKWEPLLPISEYVQSLQDDNSYETGLNGQHVFPYDLNMMSLPQGVDKRNYKLLRQTPFGNSLTKDFAISAIVNENLGKDDNPDILMVDFACTESISQAFGLNAIETEDAYLRLDEEIQHFLDFVDSYVGKGNVVVFLTSNHGAALSPKYMEDIKMPSGYFSFNQAASLLSSYLNARYGKGNWIKSFGDLQIYLNRDLIQDSKIDLAVFQQDVASFLLEFTGVANVLTSTLIERNYYADGVFRQMQNSYNSKRSGDIFINLMPGWIEKNGNLTNHNSGYRYDTHVPLLWYGWKINRRNVARHIDMTDIAPTIASFLDISFPAASSGSPIGELTE
jgi:predicted AlkP superfamily pyrophosphatase or phosphodiesterase